MTDDCIDRNKRVRNREELNLFDPSKGIDDGVNPL